LVYEGEQEGAAYVAQIASAIHTRLLSKIENWKSQMQKPILI
jgi:hypothetical protein